VSISREVVEHVARLAHIGLTDDEVPQLAVELSSVLDHVARLEEVDTSGIAPTSQVVSSGDVMRDDVALPSWPVTAVLANAPHRRDNLFEVQAVLD
jgi:aspartyl-tRNA(Asn)/glutamyl-tRNA(Gln) amidotransferase subunit C